MGFRAGWFPLSIAAFLAWGFWGFLAKLANNYQSPQSVFIYAASGSLAAAVAAFAAFGYRPEATGLGASIAFMGGMAGTLGAVFFFHAVSRGKASVVVTITALYPLLTVLLSYLFLREALTLRQAAGMALALVALILFSA